MAASDAVARCRPLPHTINREECRFRKRRWKERRRRMRFVVLWKKDFAVTVELSPDQFFHPDAFPDPKRDRHQKTFEAGRRIGQITVQNPGTHLDERID